MLMVLHPIPREYVRRRGIGQFGLSLSEQIGRLVLRARRIAEAPDVLDERKMALDLIACRAPRPEKLIGPCPAIERNGPRIGNLRTIKLTPNLIEPRQVDVVLDTLGEFLDS